MCLPIIPPTVTSLNTPTPVIVLIHFEPDSPRLSPSPLPLPPFSTYLRAIRLQALDAMQQYYSNPAMGGGMDPRMMGMQGMMQPGMMGMQPGMGQMGGMGSGMGVGQPGMMGGLGGMGYGQAYKQLVCPSLPGFGGENPLTG